MHLARKLTMGCATLAAASVAAGPALATGYSVNGMSPRLEQQALASSAANQKTAFKFFVGKGLTKKQSAGIVGNLMQESGVNPKAKQAGGAGRGIAQWSTGGRWNKYAKDNMVWYAKSKLGGVSPWGLNAQLKFTWYELTTFRNYGLAGLKKSTTIKGAVQVFEKKFEGCGRCHTDKRIAYANKVYKAYA